MNCNECGVKINDESKFCENCGNKIINDKHKKCPFCAELIKHESIKCRYCRSDLNSNESTEQKISILIPITSLILSLLGILSVVEFANDEQLTSDVLRGSALENRKLIIDYFGSFLGLSITPIGLGIMSIVNNYKGKKIGIAGLVIGFFTSVTFINIFFENI